MTSRAKELLGEYTLEQLRVLFQTENFFPFIKNDDSFIKAYYLGYLCAKGDYEKVKSFIEEIDREELETILNIPCRWNQTCLHKVLYWNNGENAIRLVELLVEHGAEFFKDWYGQFPWQVDEVGHHDGFSWVSEIFGTYIPHQELIRDPAEFRETLEIIRTRYAPPQDDYEDYEDHEDDDRYPDKEFLELFSKSDKEYSCDKCRGRGFSKIRHAISRDGIICLSEV
jgi:hypothetical protein